MFRRICFIINFLHLSFGMSRKEARSVAAARRSLVEGSIAQKQSNASVKTLTCGI